jgi:hypothetical protein
MTRFDVEALINRLSKFNLREPSFDRIGVERALQEHLRELGCPPRTIRWVDGGAQAYRYGFDWGSVEEFQLSEF